MADEENNLLADEENNLLTKKIAEINSSPHLLVTNTHQSEYKSLLKSESHEYYLFSMLQCTISPLPGNDIKCVLSKKGLELYEEVSKKVKDGLFKDTFLEHQLEKGNSGPWFALENSPWFGKSKYIEDGFVGSFNSWNNTHIHGVSEKQGRISTSTCIFVINSTSDEEGWCYTKSGSLYKLNKTL